MQRRGLVLHDPTKAQAAPSPTAAGSRYRSGGPRPLLRGAYGQSGP